jgi:hypothetical protein
MNNNFNFNIMKKRVFILLCLFPLLGIYAADNYCVAPSSETNNGGSRVFKEIFVTKKGGTSPLFTGNVHAAKPGSFAVHQDLTAQEFSVAPGDELSITYSKYADFIWAHLYVFIDYNHDKEFKKEDGELVSFTYLNGKNSLGETTSDKDISALPPFTIPATALTGKTRIRITSAWDTDNPCEIAGGNNNMIDFTINIAGDSSASNVTVTYTSNPGGQLAVRNNSTFTLVGSGSQVEKGTTIAVIAKPNNGYKVQSVTINGEDKTTQCASPNGFNHIANSNVNIQANYAVATAIDALEESNASAYVDRNGAIVIENASAGSIAKVYDATGRKVTETGILSGKTIIPANQLPNGLYVIQINYKNSQKTYKVTKKH